MDEIWSVNALEYCTLCAFDSIFVRIFECVTDLLELQLDLALRFNADWQALDKNICRWR